MAAEKGKVIGIVGGMGPEAGVHLFNCILARSEAATDQQHLSVVLVSFPASLSDRTAFLEGHTAVNPAYSVVQLIAKLETAGAGIIGLACNTVHVPAIFDVVAEELRKMNSEVKLVNMPVETCNLLVRKHPFVNRVGIMTTNGTYKAGIYQELLRNHGYEVIVPNLPFQHDVIHAMIYHPQYGIKSNAGRITPEVRKRMHKALQFFRNCRTEAIIFGCTELSLVLREEIINNMVIIDSTHALAQALIREAMNCNMQPQ